MREDTGVCLDVHLSPYLRKEKGFSFMDDPLIAHP